MGRKLVVVTRDPRVTIANYIAAEERRLGRCEATAYDLGVRDGLTEALRVFDAHQRAQALGIDAVEPRTREQLLERFAYGR